MISRRRFLKGLGLGGAAALLPHSLERGFAQATEQPRRLIVISHCHGWPYDAWRLRPEGASIFEPWTLDLKGLERGQWSQTLSPLYEHRGRMLALDGLSLTSAELDTDGNRHDKGWIHAWTGNNVDFSSADSRSLSPSIDQLVAAHIARADRLPSFEISLNAGLESGRPISYNANGVRLPAQSSPLKLWERIFGPSAQGDALGSRQRQILDFARAEHEALRPKLSARSRERLDHHYELVRSLSGRLQGLAQLSCEVGTPPAASFELYDQRFDAFAQLIGAAFSCDVTRVVSVSLGEMPTKDFGADDLTDDVHKGLAHGIYDDPIKHAAMADYLTLHAQQVARLVSLLEAIPDAGGGSLMDHTLIVWGSELADGWHGYRHYCPLLIGGQWQLKTGRYMYWPHTTPAQLLVPPSIAPGGYSQQSGQPHQRLLVSVAQTMGLEVDHVGLEHLRGQRGDFVSCAGPVLGLNT